ncbi:hypothetical protein QYE76_070680 [Lolium multiflorum]|uniref:Uncharacterized protein n=1 Tax=Lolium multiflorum TaxID=4521 RepID=A0AAD8SL10_LOLMU|nr:hypothetical protein QYE76_070680 [Lolium multiflorum]
MESYTSSGTGSAAATERPHVVLLASPGAGHLIPLAELARRLVEHHGFAATLVTFTNLSFPAHVLASCQLPASVATATLPAVDISDLPADSDIDMYVQVTRRSLPNLRTLVRSISSTGARPLAALVPDFLCSKALLVAAKLGVPGYVFVLTNLAWLALRRQLVERHHGLAPGEYRDFPEVVELGGGVSMRRADLPVLYRDPKRLAFPLLLEGGRRFIRADGFLVNTFYEMEPGLVEAFKLATEGGAFPPVFATGPLVRSQLDVNASPCLALEWLDRQPTGSVVYVSLGSGRALSLEQTTELAAGIEDSGQRFLWVVRMPDLTTSELETAAAGGNKDDPLAWLPEGFLERTAGRGLAITAWSPQVRALSHPATAAFVSHCAGGTRRWRACVVECRWSRCR